MCDSRGGSLVPSGVYLRGWGRVGKKKQRLIIDASHLAGDYDSLSRTDDRAMKARQGEALAAEAKNIQINSKIAEHAVATLPSVHTMLHNSYSIIDSELRRLGRQSQRCGLDRTETGQFEKYAHSLVRLVKMESEVRDNSALDAMSDKELTEQVLKKLKESTDE